ncbi:hypothetical protein BGZ65_009590, partial [Modicella reniformis]
MTAGYCRSHYHHYYYYYYYYYSYYYCEDSYSHCGASSLIEYIKVIDSFHRPYLIILNTPTPQKAPKVLKSLNFSTSQQPTTMIRSLVLLLVIVATLLGSALGYSDNCQGSSRCNKGMGPTCRGAFARYTDNTVYKDYTSRTN